MERKSNEALGNLLNIQMLFDKLEDRGLEARMCSKRDPPCLRGMQFYYGQRELSDRYIYLCEALEIKRHPFALENGFLALLGEPEEQYIPSGCSFIVISGVDNIHMAANHIQQIFVEYELIERKLNKILNNDGSVYDICVLALECFKNPLFVHDEHFNILACPQFVEGVTNFTYNEQTEKYMQDVETINYFRTSRTYRKTLLTHGGQLWKSDFSNGRALYVNIWIGDNYKGRLVINAVTTPLKRGQLYEAEYFAEIIREVLQRRYVKRGEEMNSLQNFIMDAVNGVKIDYGLLYKKISALGWNPFDHYVCGMISFENEAVTQLSVFSICNEIEERVEESYACYFKNTIYLLINLTAGNLQLPQLRRNMSYIIRESLLHMGVSNEFCSINDFFIHIKQAEAALRYGRELTSWYNEFNLCALKYWMEEGMGEFTKETISSPALTILRLYDKDHGTDLYLTLKTYLTYERNTSLTARVLKIHRSTLPHRLDRIIQLIGLNLDDFKTRLYLMMSFTILEEGVNI